jgi:hypothetical protein
VKQRRIRVDRRIRTTLVVVNCAQCSYAANARSGEAAIEGYEEHLRWHEARAQAELSYTRAAG